VWVRHPQWHHSPTPALPFHSVCLCERCSDVAAIVSLVLRMSKTLMHVVEAAAMFVSVNMHTFTLVFVDRHRRWWLLAARVLFGSSTGCSHKRRPFAEEEAPISIRPGPAAFVFSVPPSGTARHFSLKEICIS
jgi:hypothetical protein